MTAPRVPFGFTTLSIAITSAASLLAIGGELGAALLFLFKLAERIEHEGGRVGVTVAVEGEVEVAAVGVLGVGDDLVQPGGEVAGFVAQLVGHPGGVVVAEGEVVAGDGVPAFVGDGATLAEAEVVVVLPEEGQAGGEAGPGGGTLGVGGPEVAGDVGGLGAADGAGDLEHRGVGFVLEVGAVDVAAVGLGEAFEGGDAGADGGGRDVEAGVGGAVEGEQRGGGIEAGAHDAGGAGEGFAKVVVGPAAVDTLATAELVELALGQGGELGTVAGEGGLLQQGGGGFEDVGVGPRCRTGWSR